MWHFRISDSQARFIYQYLFDEQGRDLQSTRHSQVPVPGRPGNALLNRHGKPHGQSRQVQGN